VELAPKQGIRSGFSWWITAITRSLEFIHNLLWQNLYLTFVIYEFRLIYHLSRRLPALNLSKNVNPGNAGQDLSRPEVSASKDPPRSFLQI
jgi:hypothetical protein